MVSVTRRRALKAIGAGALLGLGTDSVSASSRERVFVHPDGDRSQAANALRDHGGTVLFTYDNWDFVAGVMPAAHRSDLQTDDRVARVEDDGQVHAIHHKDDHDGGPPGGGGGDEDDGGCGDHPAQEGSWGYDRIDADQVTEATGSGVDVAILDTGIDTEHCDLTLSGGTNCTGKGNGYDDKNGHGTHCAGIATADDNSIGVVGVAPAANLYAVKVLDNSGSGRWSYVVCGIDWCMNNGREILSMSFGASSMPESAHTAIEDASAEGHLLVAAAGNSGNDEDGDCSDDNNVGQPARHPDVIAVSSMDSNDSLAGYSSVGPDVEIMAPGTDIRSTYKGDSYETLSGTSMACPHVSGTAGMVWEIYGSDGPNVSDRDAIREIMMDTAETVLGTCEEGAGLLDAEATADEAVTRT